MHAGHPRHVVQNSVKEESLTSLQHVAACLSVLVLAAGCASTTVTEQHYYAGTTEVARPDHIYVYPFAATPDDIPTWSAAAGRQAQPRTPEEAEAGRKLGALVAKDLVSEIQGMGLPGEVSGPQTTLQVNDLMFLGYFESIEKGSAGDRVTLGFGSGAAELRTAVEAYQMTKDGPRQLGSGRGTASGGKTPGLIVPAVVMVATANPIGLMAGGAAKAQAEMAGKDTIEGLAKNTAKTIAERLRLRFKEQGWIR